MSLRSQWLAIRAENEQTGEPTDAYLRELGQALRVSPIRQRRIIAEVRAHLADLAAAARRDGKSPSQAECWAIERMGSATEMAARFPPSRWKLRLATRTGLLVGGMLVLTAIAAPIGQGSPVISAKNTVWLPDRAWAKHCIAYWNSPAQRQYRLLIAHGGPFLFKGEDPTDPYVGEAVRAQFPYGPVYGFDANRPFEGCLAPIVTFRKGDHYVRLRPVPWAIGIPRAAIPSVEDSMKLVSRASLRHRVLITTWVDSHDGRFAYPEPPVQFGHWGGALQLTVTLLSARRVPITANKTCITLAVAVNRPAKVVVGGGHDPRFSRNDQPRRPPMLMRPKEPMTRRTCFSWQNRVHDLTSVLPLIRRVYVNAIDARTPGVLATARLTFRVIPASPHNSQRVATTRSWSLAYYSAQEGWDFAVSRPGAAKAG